MHHHVPEPLRVEQEARTAVQGQANFRGRIGQTVTPGDDPLKLTFGTDGGTLALQCGSCLVTLDEEAR